MAQRRTNLFPSAARTTHTDSKIVNLQGSDTVTVDINVTAFSGTSITFTVQGKDSQGNWFNVLATAAINATGRSTLTIGPQSPTTTNVSSNRVLPLVMKLVPTGTITSVTYYVDLTEQRSLPY